MGRPSLDHPVIVYPREPGRSDLVGDKRVVDAAMNYSPLWLAIIALAVLLVAWWIESFDKEPTIAGALTIGACAIALGAFVLCFINYLGPLP